MKKIPTLFGAGEFFALTAVVVVSLCRAIEKITSAVPRGFTDGRNLAASRAGFVYVNLTGIAVDAADGQVLHFINTLLSLTSILPSQKRRTASGRIFHSASCIMRSWRVSGVSSCLTSTARWSTMGPASHSGMTI